MSGRDEIDARQHRCDKAMLRPDRHFTGFPIGPDDQICALPPLLQPHLLSHEEARIAGEAMFERAHLMAPELRLAMTKDDSGWADMLRAGWEAVWAARSAARGGWENGEEPKG